MDPVTLVAIPGLVGGVCLALLLRQVNRRATSRPAAAADEPISTDVINIARIRVAGLGGLGLVTMAVAVAVALPGVGRPLAAGLVLGLVLGVGLILVRRSAGPMPSSGAQPGANTTLSIDSINPPDAQK